MSSQTDDHHPTASGDETLLAPYNYICSMGGKQIRGKLARAFNYWLQIDDERLTAICEVVQMLHNASLMIDDIEDSSTLRRGLPVAHSIFGTPTTINTANLVYFLALQKTLKLEHAEATRVFTEQLIELHRGQGLEIHWRDSGTCPTEEQYISMVKQKTGGLFHLAVRLMQLFAPRSAAMMDYGTLVDQLGMYFQIRDDYCNLVSKEYEDKKTYCEDLTEGKFSLPIIYAVSGHSGVRDLVLNILRQRPTEVHVKRYCVDLLTECGALQRCRQRLVDLETGITAEIQRLGGNPFMLTVIEELSISKQS